MSLEGRGLWFGVSTAEDEHFSLGQWDAVCQQARRWGISVLHPKVGECNLSRPQGAWYSRDELVKMAHTAQSYQLQCVPYLFCYGNRFGLLAQEASLVATVGQIFGGVSPDMEDEWNNQHDWAQEFGQLIRHAGYTGPLYPTVYANPEQHPAPLKEMSVWATAFLPQVYFSVWTEPTAMYALNYFLPQWERFYTALKKEGSLPAAGQHIPPFQPIISLTNGVAQSEVSNFIHAMHLYGYIGFWYDQVYSQYAQTILAAPIPKYAPLNQPISPKPPPAPTPAPGPTTKPLPLPSLPLPVVKETTPRMASYQNLTPDELTAIWQTKYAISQNPASAIFKRWAEKMQTEPGSIGYPLHGETAREVGGKKEVFITFSDGTEITYFEETGHLAIVKAS